VATVGVIVEVDEDVIVPVIFDVNVNATLIVIGPVDPVLGVPSTVSITPTVSFTFRCTATITGERSRSRRRHVNAARRHSAGRS
jgi:hypothetical protein